MMRQVLSYSGSLLLFVMTACTQTWNHPSGTQTLPKASIIIKYSSVFDQETDKTVDSRAIALVIPAGWRRLGGGNDFMATRDGILLQNLFVERIHVSQTYPPDIGAYPYAFITQPKSREWRTPRAKSLKTQFTAGMLPADAVDVLLESRRNDWKVTDFQVQKVVTCMVAGRRAFRAVFDFRFVESVLKPSPVYRSVYCGFMEGDWFYGISYTAALRYYFDKDADTFEAFLESIRLVEE